MVPLAFNDFRESHQRDERCKCDGGGVRGGGMLWLEPTIDETDTKLCSTMRLDRDDRPQGTGYGTLARECSGRGGRDDVSNVSAPATFGDAHLLVR